MKLTDIIPKSSEIREGDSQLFIAEKDFTFKGLSILKDSLVECDNEGISVNLIEFSVFQSKSVQGFSGSRMSEDDTANYLIERCSTCKYEIEELDLGWRGIWHDDHFDKWESSINHLPNCLARVKERPILEYSGITFSSLYYHFDMKAKTLDRFITMKPFGIEVKGEKIILPAYLEISLYKNRYTLTPLTTMEYQGKSYEGVCYLLDDGTISDGLLYAD
jgi:hypothetical protein